MTGLISPLEIAASDQSPSEATPETLDTPHQADDLSLVRELILKAHLDVVPELIGGDSVASIVASISPAQAAYAELAARIQSSSGQATPGATVPRVPAGSIVSAPVDLDRLPASEKLRRGVQARANRSGRE